MKLFRIVTTYACAAVYINENDIIIDSAPIFKWAKGETIKGFISILKKQKMYIEHQMIEKGAKYE